MEWIKDWDKSIVLKEPTKMTGNEIDELYRHLLLKQSIGKELAWIKSAERNKRVVSKDGEGKAKDKASDIQADLDDDNSNFMGNLEESWKTNGVGDNKMEGSSSKRHPGMPGCGEAPPAKKQKRMDSDRSTRYEAL